jgi:hypothetical protein
MSRIVINHSPEPVQVEDNQEQELIIGKYPTNDSIDKDIIGTIVIGGDDTDIVKILNIVMNCVDNNYKIHCLTNHPAGKIAENILSRFGHKDTSVMYNGRQTMLAQIQRLSIKSIKSEGTMIFQLVNSDLTRSEIYDVQLLMDFNAIFNKNNVYVN